jgi:hypothetical protein
LGYYEKYVYIIDKYITNNTNQYITTDLKEKLLDKSTKLKKMETSAYITNVICTKSEVETARNAQSKGITIEQQIEENKRLAELKKSIERGSFTGEHYYDYENYKYIGHFLNGKPDGNGKWEKVDGSWYSGQFKNGVENGIGTLRQTDGFRYTGNFTDGVPNGKMKVEKWTLMGLAKNAWTAEYKMGQLISSEQTEDGMDKLFSSKGSSSSSSSSPSNTNSSNQDYKETKNSIQNVTFEIDRKNACQDAIESYEIRVYEDGKRLEKITVAKRKDNQWLDYCPGSILGGSYLTNGGSLINALKYYYTKILKKTAISFDLKE